MKNQKLKEKVAKWAGFTWKKHPKGDWFMYYLPNGKFFGNNLPDFLHDETVCFKWLAPKLNYMDIEWSQMSWKGPWTQVRIDARVAGEEHFAEDKKVAMALCKAIAKRVNSPKIEGEVV